MTKEARRNLPGGLGQATSGGRSAVGSAERTHRSSISLDPSPQKLHRSPPCTAPHHQIGSSGGQAALPRPPSLRGTASSPKLQQRGGVPPLLSKSSQRSLEPADWSLGGWAESPPPAPDDVASLSHTSRLEASEAGRSQTSSEIRNVGIPPSCRQRAAAILPKPELRVTATGARALASVLSENPGGYLVTLSLNNNAVGSSGAECLLRGVSTNFTLSTLLLRCACIIYPCTKSFHGLIYDKVYIITDLTW